MSFLLKGAKETLYMTLLNVWNKPDGWRESWFADRTQLEWPPSSALSINWYRAMRIEDVPQTSGVVLSRVTTGPRKSWKSHGKVTHNVVKFKDTPARREDCENCCF